MDKLLTRSRSRQLISLRVIFFVFCSLVSFGIYAENAAYRMWAGKYSYRDSFGQAGGGDPNYIEMDLTLSKNGACRLERRGYQLDDAIICSIRNRGLSQIDVRFLLFSTGIVKNTYGVVIFRPGDILFSLSLDATASLLTTHWGAIDPTGVTAVGKYFLKSGG